MENITLYFKQGSSDKVYQARIEPQDGGYVVNFAFGRRGTTLTAGTKTTKAVDYEAAKAIYEKLVREKSAKGYTPGEDGTPYQFSDKTSTGIHCQLLNPIEEDQIGRLIADPAYWMQQKYDGRRLLIDKRGGQITGINRLGLAVALPESLAREVAVCPAADLTLDGECIGDDYHTFDALLAGGGAPGSLPYDQRYPRLKDLLATFQHPHIHLVETHCTPEEKRSALERMKADGCEGVVFKRTDAAYTAGRPASGGTHLKFKFCETASFIVGKINAQRSISLQLFHGDTMTGAGNVTIPPNRELPEAGQVVECRYLYAFPESGSIFQPVYLGVRDDMRPDECTTSQLKYKAGARERVG